jgi:hypothetical protein
LVGYVLEVAKDCVVCKNFGVMAMVSVCSQRFGKSKGCLTVRARGRLDSHRQIGFFVALGFVRFVGESRPASRR